MARLKNTRLVVEGNPPGSLEWVVESGVQRAAAGSTLTLDAVQLTDTGNYTCVAVNIYGTESSDAAHLRVNGTNLRSSIHR